MVRLTDRELDFFALCGPLEDAIDMLDAGRIDAARDLLRRILEQAAKRDEDWKNGGRKQP